MGEWVEITDGVLTAAINPLGAELSSLKDAGGRELMTDANPAFWGGRAPILFPIVGRLNGDLLRVNGREYPMMQHGFARNMRFEIVDATRDRVIFRLADTPETRGAYPFAFRLDIAFTIAEATLSTDVTITNPGAEVLPASFGFHPAFAWPLPYGAPRDGHWILFGAEDSGTVKRLEDGLIAGDRSSPLHGFNLSLSDALFDEDALIWLDPPSPSVVYGAEDPADPPRIVPQLHIAFPDTPALGIWTKPGARFVCIEPWHGHADPEGYTGDFRDKPGVFEVPAGGEKRISMSVTLVD